MKTLLFAIGLAGIAAAEDYQLTVHMVAMEPAKLTELLAGAGGPSIEKAREMVKAGEARLFDTMLLRMKSGVTARLWSGGEMIYPSEFEGGGLGSPDPHLEKMRRMYFWGQIFPFMNIQGGANIFEVKEVGERIECKVGADGRTKWHFELPRYAGDSVFVEHHGLEGEKSEVRFPVFEKLSLNLGMAPGGWHCAGVLGIPGKDGSPGEKIVVFAKTTALVMEE